MQSEEIDRIRYSIDVLERTGTFLDPGNHALMDRHLRQASVAAVQTGASDPGCLGALGRLLAAATARVAGTAGEGAYAVAGDVEAGAATKAKKASKLELAVAAVEGRVTELQQRAVDLRAKAKELGVAGQKAAALQALKRARAIDAQAATASASALALERQVDMIEQAQVSVQVSSALAAANAKTKRSTKGLLTKAENAVENASELHDLSSDVGAVLGEMAAGGDAEDDDGLLAELNEMVEQASAAAPPTGAAAPSTASTTGGAGVRMPATISSILAEMPAAPKAPVGPKREEGEAPGVAVAA